MGIKKLVKENLRLILKIRNLETELSLSKSMSNELQADNAKDKAGVKELEDFLEHEDNTPVLIEHIH